MTASTHTQIYTSLTDVTSKALKGLLPAFNTFDRDDLL
jgi:hypothetical protein